MVTSKKKIKDKAVFLATQARDKSVAYLHSHIGYNYRMSNVIAGIGRGQMTVLDKHVKLRRKNYRFYEETLGNLDSVELLNEPQDYFSNRWLSCMLLDSNKSREALRLEFDKENIETRPLWKPMHQQPIFSDCKAYINGVSDNLFERGLCLPSGSNLTNLELDRIYGVLKSFFALS